MHGSAENLADGSVLVIAAGAAVALEDFANWLRQGPPLARVATIESTDIDPAGVSGPAGFVTK